MAALCWSSREEIPHAQGRRNPSKMVGVARGHQRADTLKPYSQKTSQSHHTRTTALSNSMKLSHACGATQDGRVMVERSDRIGSPRRKQFCLHLDPALCENKFLLFKPPDLWYFIRTVLANEYRRQDYFMGTMIPFNKWFWHNWTVTY